MTAFRSALRDFEIDGIWLDIRPAGSMVLFQNLDRPGVLAAVGAVLAERGVNIATMSLSRNQAGGTALTVLNLDTAPGEDVLAAIRASDDIHSAQVIEL